MKVKLMFGMFAAALGLSGCQKPPQDKLVIVRGQAYLIPWQDRPTITPLGDEMYVRISRKKISSGQEIQLLYDHSFYDIEIANGFPSLFGVTGSTEKEIRKLMNQINSPIGPIFCAKPYSEDAKFVMCGFRITDKNISWSVNFGSEYIGDVTILKSEALRVLQSYREAADAK
jgi:hypothetical protein